MVIRKELVNPSRSQNNYSHTGKEEINIPQAEAEKAIKDDGQRTYHHAEMG